MWKKDEGQKVKICKVWYPDTATSFRIYILLTEVWMGIIVIKNTIVPFYYEENLKFANYIYAEVRYVQKWFQYSNKSNNRYWKFKMYNGTAYVNVSDRKVPVYRLTENSCEITNEQIGTIYPNECFGLHSGEGSATQIAFRNSSGVPTIGGIVDVFPNCTLYGKKKSNGSTLVDNPLDKEGYYVHTLAKSNFIKSEVIVFQYREGWLSLLFSLVNESIEVFCYSW